MDTADDAAPETQFWLLQTALSFESCDLHCNRSGEYNLYRRVSSQSGGSSAAEDPASSATPSKGIGDPAPAPLNTTVSSALETVTLTNTQEDRYSALSSTPIGGFILVLSPVDTDGKPSDQLLLVALQGGAVPPPGEPIPIETPLQASQNALTLTDTLNLGALSDNDITVSPMLLTSFSSAVAEGNTAKTTKDKVIALQTAFRANPTHTICVLDAQFAYVFCTLNIDSQ